jgi:hypothetical protein
VTVLAKATVWVLAIVVRWVSRVVCTVVQIVIGVFMAPFDEGKAFKEVVGDVWELVKEVFYSATGLVIYNGLYVFDAIQTVVGVQQRKRRLTPAERRLLYPIFRDSLVYDAIRIVEGNAGLLGSGRAFTMGWTIYMPTLDNATLVHECVHVWQFQFEGTRYIGDSAFNQLDRIIFSPGPRGGTAVHWRDKKRVNRQTSSGRLHSNSELWRAPAASTLL